MEREQGAVSAMLTVTAEAYGLGSEEFEDDLPVESGTMVPGSNTVLALCFAGCTLMLAGLPPLAGFLGKFAMLSAAIGFGTGADGQLGGGALAFVILMLVSGLAALIALARAGISTFWATDAEDGPRDVRVVEMLPVVVLLFLAIFMTVKAEPVMRYMQAAAATLHAPQDYPRQVLGRTR